MQRIYQQCFERDGWKCRHCNDRNAIHPHHVIYRSQQGGDSLDNLITLCWQCHAAHHEGKLGIKVLDKTPTNVLVSFERVKGWKPV